MTEFKNTIDAYFEDNLEIVENYFNQALKESCLRFSEQQLEVQQKHLKRHNNTNSAIKYVSRLLRYELWSQSRRSSVVGAQRVKSILAIL